MMNEDVIVSLPTQERVKRNAFKALKWLYIGIIMLLLYLPVIFIIILSFNKNKVGTEFTTFTLEFYKGMFEKEMLRDAIINTLSISILSTLLSTILGTLFAIGINGLSKKKRKAIILMNNIPILNADIVSAVFLFLIFRTLGNFMGIRYPLGYVTLLLSHMFFSLPYVVLSVLPKLKEIDENLFDAALDLGCKPKKALNKVIIPSIVGGIFSGAVLAFTMSIDDFTISYFVSGAKIQNLSIWIYTSSSNARFGNMQSAYAFYSVVTIFLFVGLLSYYIFKSKKIDKKKGALR